MVTILDGKKLSEQILEKIRQEIKKYKTKPCLAVIIIGEGKASKIYFKTQQRICEKIGILLKKYTFPNNVKEMALVSLIKKLNSNNNIHGILAELPLPKRLNQEAILSSISPEKDVDGLHPLNLGKLLTDQETFVPCTPKGIVRILDEYNIGLGGKDVVIISRSINVGKPLSLLMLKRGATITLCHKDSKNISTYTKKADIIVTAVGLPKFLKRNMIKQGAIVIDVGISKKDGKVVGDVDFENVKKIAGYITPVPGGIGPMTVAMLMENTLIAYKKQRL